MGKGGSGKSTLAGLLATALVEAGQSVVAFDADSVPGLGQVLGMDPSDDWFLAGSAERRDGGWSLVASPPQTVGERARTTPGGIRFIQIGNVGAELKDFEFRRESFPEMWSATMAFNTVARTYDEAGGWVVVDLQGGTLQVAGGMAGTSGFALLVVEPFAKSVLTARRFVEMKPWPPGLRLVAVGNKVRDAADREYLESSLAELDVPLWACIGFDPAAGLAEREARALAGLDPSAGLRRAAVDLAERFMKEAAPVSAVEAR
ncbi:MAG: nucleotide-binding protein [Acidimicrobiales bacterium]